MHITLITVVGGHLEVLPHMLEHYRTLGVDELIIHAHAETCGDPSLEHIAVIAAEHNALIASTNIGPWIPSVNQVLYSLSRAAKQEEWFLLADADEFQAYPDELRRVLAFCDKEHYSFIEGALVDRLSGDGNLIDVAPKLSIWDQFPLGSLLSGVYMGSVINKVVAVKGGVLVSEGQHAALSGRGCPPGHLYVPVHHFKWNSAVRARLSARLVLREKLRSNNADLYSAECTRFLETFGERGRVDVNDPNLLVAACTPDYPHWTRVTDWRQHASCFSTELAARRNRMEP